MAFVFSSFDAVLLDLDGTLYRDEQPMPGGVELLARLKREGKRVGCPTNSVLSPQRIPRRLAGMGIDIPAADILPAAEAAVESCLARFPSRPRIFNLATEGVAEMLAGRAVDVQIGDASCDAVIVANPQAVFATKPRMYAAVRLLRAGAFCAGICDDRVYPGIDGLEIGSGAMTRMIAYAAAVEPVFSGKPRAEFFHSLCRRLGADAERCLMIGDNLESDIAGGKNAGMKTMLVLGGVSSRADVERLAEAERPDWIFESLEELAR